MAEAAGAEAAQRAGILALARDLIYRNGYSGTTLDEIAQTLHIAKSHIYRHFAGKQDLLGEIALLSAVAINAGTERALATVGTPGERLEAIVGEFLDVVESHGREIAIFYREQQFIAPKALQRMLALQSAFDVNLSRLLVEGAAAGDFEIEDPRFTTLAIDGIMCWMYMLARAPDADVGHAKKVMIELVLRAVGARPVGRPASPSAAGKGRSGSGCKARPAARRSRTA